MSSRHLRLAEEIKREVSVIVANEMKDPRLGMVTITDVEVSNDLSWAKVFFSTLGDEEEREKNLAALDKAKGFIRSELAKRIKVRHTPEITFKFDPSLEQGAKMDALLKSLHIHSEEGSGHDE